MSGRGFEDASYAPADRLMNAVHPLLGGENMQTSKCDRKGRLLLRPALRRRYGDQFFIVEAPREVILLPVPSDPVKDLQRLGRKLEGYTIEELKKVIDEQADKEIDETLDRLGLRRIPLEGQQDLEKTRRAIFSI